MTSSSKSAAPDPEATFAIWPPVRVSEVDPFDFGVATGAGLPLGRALNPYVARDIDEPLVEHLSRRRAVVVSAADGSGATRTVYEVLNRLLPDAFLFVPRRPGEFDPAGLPVAPGDKGVLWMGKLGAQWGVLGERLFDSVWDWLHSGEHWFVALCLDGEPDALGSPGFAALRFPVLRLESDLSPGELAAMQSAYGQVTTRASIGYNPPLPQAADDVLSGFSNTVRQVALSLGPDAMVTASMLADEVRQRHPEYVGGRLRSVHLDSEAGERRPVAGWLSLVRACYDPATLAESRHKVIDGRLTLAALAALDPALAAQMGAAAREALENECDIRPVPPAAREHVRWLADEPVGLDQDELGRRGVAVALEQQLRTLVRDFPGRSFLVHIDGAWGASKSTLLRFLRDTVDSPESGGAADRWLVVNYDAWRQSRAGPPWLTLLQAVRTAVGASRRHRGSRGWFWLRERARLVSTWQWIALGMMAAAVGALTVLIQGRTDLTLSKWGDVVGLVGGLVPVVAALWLLAKSAGSFVSLGSRRSARTFLETRADPMEDLAAHFDWVLRTAGRPVLLLVDDLDRCSETFVVDLLDSVQKLMRDRAPDADTKRPRPVPSLLVVVAADGRWVRASYDNAYASLARAVNEPGASVGTLFLEKLFQLTVPVPR